MTDRNPPKPRVFTVDAAAAEAGVSRSSIYRLINSGELQTIQMPGVSGNAGQRITEVSLRAYIASRSSPYEVVRGAPKAKPQPESKHAKDEPWDSTAEQKQE